MFVYFASKEFVYILQVAEDKDVPARVTLLEIPSKNEVRVKNLFNVADCKMHWQKTGDYLCVKVKIKYHFVNRNSNNTNIGGGIFKLLIGCSAEFTNQKPPNFK